ncbi:MAG: ABC transporter substrate-binding protein [Deltaproteobacteria bacterium]|nr:ABC transporter substrate-binding protein [Deltaproteobacteria bacterium]
MSNHRRFCRVLGFVLSASLTIFCSAAYGQSRRVLLGYSSLSSNQTPVWVGKEEGFYKRFGLDAELILIEGGTRAAQALISGDMPAMFTAGQPIISARARGSDLVLIGGVVNKMNYILASAPAIKRPEDLRGKRVGITQIGSSSYHAVVLALKHWGLDPRKDRVTMLQVGNQAARVASLQTGGSDAVIVNPGLGTTLKERGFNVLADFTELPIPYPQQVLATRERTLKTDPDLLEKILKGFVAANSFCLDSKNKEKVKAVLVKYLRLESVNKAEEHYQSAMKVLPKKPYVELAGISSMIDFMAETDPLVAKVKAEEVINHSLLKRLDESGFIDQPFRK